MICEFQSLTLACSYSVVLFRAPSQACSVVSGVRVVCIRRLTNLGGDLGQIRDRYGLHCVLVLCFRGVVAPAGGLRFCGATYRRGSGSVDCHCVCLVGSPMKDYIERGQNNQFEMQIQDNGP